MITISHAQPYHFDIARSPTLEIVQVQVVKGADGAPRVKRQYTKRSPKWGPAAVKQEETETEPKEEAEAAADTAEPALELRSSVLGRRTSKPKLPESAAPLPIKRRRKYITTAKEGALEL